MIWYKLIAIFALATCFFSCIYHFLRLIKLGKPTDFSRKLGDTNSAIRFSFIGAMSPSKKESAYLHLPTYSAGIVFHLGTFLSILLFFINLFGISISRPFNLIFAVFLVASALCGVGILIKRIVTSKLRSLSNPDDYLSNSLVTLFQLFTAAVMVSVDFTMFYYIVSSLLLLYLPIGKLKHTLYFFAARYHLGFFYGWRGVWPPK